MSEPQPPSPQPGEPTQTDRNVRCWTEMTSFFPGPFEFAADHSIRKDKRTIVFSHPTLDYLRDRLCDNQPHNYRPGGLRWAYFPDGTPNFEFEDPQNLRGKNIVFLCNFCDLSYVTEQYVVLVVLPRQNILRLDIVVPYFGPATMERVDREGIIATAEPCMKLLSGLEPCAMGQPTLHFYDIHAIGTRFYADPTVKVALQSALPLLEKHVTFLPQEFVQCDPDDKRVRISAIAFPDDGAYKRFGKMKMFEGVPVFICAKIRDGDQRKVIIRECINDRGPSMWTGTVLIIDDLVQSGGTLRECRDALIRARPDKQKNVRVAAYCTHAVFPNDSWKRFTQEVGDELSFTHFFLTNSNLVALRLVGHAPFVVLPLEECLAADLRHPDIARTPKPRQTGRLLPGTRVFVASTNREKLRAAYRAVEKVARANFNHRAGVIGLKVASGVQEQPIGTNEAMKGASTRFRALKNAVAQLIDDGHLSKNDAYGFLLVSFENGLVEETPGNWYDICCVNVGLYSDKPPAPEFVVDLGGRTPVPCEFVDLVRKTENTTVGQLFHERYGWPADAWHKHVMEERWLLMSRQVERLLCDFL